MALHRPFARELHVIVLVARARRRAEPVGIGRSPGTRRWAPRRVTGRPRCTRGRRARPWWTSKVWRVRPTIAKLGDLAAESGLHRVSILAWRDLDDPEAGGSEVHASTVARLWAEAGLEVTMRTSFASGQPQMSWRDGYRVIRKAGRYMVFPRAAFSEMMGWHGGRDGLVEIWNGMPFMSPLWARTPHVTWLHHVHADMWDMTLPPRLATVGPHARVDDRAEVLPADADRHPVELVEAGAGRRPRVQGRRWCTWSRRASTRASRPAARSRRRRSWSPSAGSCR